MGDAVKIKTTVAVLAAGVALFTTTGCAAQQLVDPVQVQLPDGRTVDCVSRDGGGIDCDWDGAR